MTHQPLALSEEEADVKEHLEEQQENKAEDIAIQTENEREKERETEKQTETERVETERETEREKERETEKQTETERVETERETEKQTQTKPALPPNRSVEDDANWLSFATFSFLNPLFQKGYQTPLEHSDLGIVSQQDRTELLYKRFLVQWEKEKLLPKEQRSLWFTLWRMVGYHRLLLAVLLYVVYTAESFGPILILNRLIQHFQGTQTLSTTGLWVCVCLLFILPMTGSVFAAHSNTILYHIGLQFRNALVNMIYRKALVLSPAARQQSSTGQIVNMFSSDTSQVQRFLFFINNMLLAVPTIIVCLVLIYGQVGPATFVGLGLIIFIMPLNSVIFLMLAKLRRKKVLETDQRVKLMNEILNGIRIIKYYAWEVAFEEKVGVCRAKELLILKQMAYVVAIAFTLVLQAVPVFLPVVIFLTYVKLGNHLDAATAFTTIALFNLMQFPFVFLPMGLSQYSQSVVSTQRMLNFFDAEELHPYVVSEPSIEEPRVVISMENASLGWINEEVTPSLDKVHAVNKEANVDVEVKGNKQVAEEGSAIDTHDTNGIELQGLATSIQPVNRSIKTLNNFSIKINKGQLVAIVGPVGSGKSSILSALLGEMLHQEGLVRVHGTVAYCDQRPWILNDTVKGNILFGSEYNEEKFDIAMFAANLENDVKILPGGIETQIGERGINLSGGQKARVSLARAIYRDADIYLLDDPLSAVDAHVGQFLFQECICNILKAKTRILVTHQVHYLPLCDLVLIVENGELKASGTYQELLSSGIDLTAYLPEQSIVSSSEKESKEMDKGIDSTKMKEASAHRKQDNRSSTIISKEERTVGDVTSDIYAYYIKAGGVGYFLGFLSFIVIGQLFSVLGSYWLQYWGTTSVHHDRNNDPLTSSQNIRFLQVFAALAGASLLGYVLRSLLLANHRLGTSVVFHQRLLKSTLFAPISFFDVTPVGRILNRFSSDMSSVDEELSQTLSQASNSFAAVLGAFGAITGATKGTFLLFMIPLFYFYYSVQRYFRSTNTTIARLESVSRSPIYADFSQALTGLTTIRAYQDKTRFIDGLESAINHNSIANISTQLCSQWLALRLDFMGSLISFFIAVIAASTNGFIPAGFVAVGLTYSFQLTTYLKFLIRMIASGEAQVNSIERIKYYMDNIPQEEFGSTSAEVPTNWPEHGSIVAENISMSYRDGPLILDNVSFNIAPKEKVGIVGRTGSGKSSTVVALFRIQELAQGKIYIDNIDTSIIPLELLRSKLGIIPQDPVMFSASIRFNLDPFNQYGDEELWSVLEQVKMKDHIRSLPLKLDQLVSEGGDNFSAGQRQLICIARAILRKPKILVLDEATASIDNETDAMIQQMVRETFQDCTVLTIAHRLNTIVDSDRIMVLENGTIAEMDSPANLLAKPDGSFTALWERHAKSHGK